MDLSSLVRKSIGVMGDSLILRFIGKMYMPSHMLSIIGCHLLLLSVLSCQSLHDIKDILAIQCI